MHSPMRPLRGPHMGTPDLTIRLSAFAAAMVAIIYIAFAPIGLDLLYNPLIAGEYNSPWPVIYGLARYFACLGFAGAVLLTKGRGDYFKALAPLAPFLLFCAISFTWSVDQKNTYKQLFYLVCVAIWIAAIVKWIGIAALLRISSIINSVIVILSFLLAVFVPHIGQHQGGDLIEPGHAGNWRGMFIHKNILGEFAVTTLLLLLRDIRQEKRAWRLFFWVARFAAVACLLFSKSSNALVGAAAGCGAYMLLMYRPTSKPVILAVFAAVVAALVFGFSITPETVATVLHRDSHFSGRTEIWAFGQNMIQQHIWMGHGYAAAENYFTAIGTAMIFESATELHNGYLDVLFNGGIVGAVLLFGGVIFVVGRAYLATFSTRGVDRHALVTYIAIIVSACAMATGESSPFRVVGDGVVGFWISLVALGNLAFVRSPSVSGAPAQFAGKTPTSGRGVPLVIPVRRLGQQTSLAPAPSPFGPAGIDR